MNRAAFGVDRLVALVLGLLLVVGGLWTLLWAAEWLPEGWWAPARFEYEMPSGVTDADWWPWALLGGGVVLAAIGATWFGRHFGTPSVSRLSLPGDAEGGRLMLDGGAFGSGVAAALKDGSDSVVGAKGGVIDQRRRVILDVTASIRRDADLREVVALCDRVAAQALRSSGRNDMACRIRLKVAPRAGRAPRVH